MILGFLTLKILLIIGHVFGVIIGAGGAFAGDGIFLMSVRDGKLSKTELKFIRHCGTMVWIGLAIITITGIGLFSTNMEYYMTSSKFLAKMSIVGILVLNGLVFHLSHIPRMMRHAGEFFTSSDEFMRKRKFMLASGAVSGASWIAAFILGSLHSVPYSYVTIMLVYVVFVAAALTFSILFGSKLIPKI